MTDATREKLRRELERLARSNDLRVRAAVAAMRAFHPEFSSSRRQCPIEK